MKVALLLIGIGALCLLYSFVFVFTLEVMKSAVCLTGTIFCWGWALFRLRYGGLTGE